MKQSWDRRYERCENPSCGKQVDTYLYAIEVRGVIKRFVCESCYFRWLKNKEKRKDESHRPMQKPVETERI